MTREILRLLFWRVRRVVRALVLGTGEFLAEWVAECWARCRRD